MTERRARAGTSRQSSAARSPRAMSRERAECLVAWRPAWVGQIILQTPHCPSSCSAARRIASRMSSSSASMPAAAPEAAACHCSSSLLAASRAATTRPSHHPSSVLLQSSRCQRWAASRARAMTRAHGVHEGCVLLLLQLECQGKGLGLSLRWGLRCGHRSSADGEIGRTNSTKRRRPSGANTWRRWRHQNS